MAAFVPKTYTNGKRTEVANSAIEESNLLWAGWWVVGTYTPTPEQAFSDVQLEALGAFARSADAILTGTVGLPGGSSGNPRLPVNGSVVIDGAVAKNFPGDKVGYAFSATIKGGFSGDTGGNPTFAWGANDYVVTGTAVGDISALGNIVARETEVHMQTPGADLGFLTGLQVDAGVEATATGAHVHTMYGIHVTALANHAADATVDMAFGVFIDGPTAGTNNVGLGVGGKALFYGDVQLVDTHIVAGSGGLIGRTVQLGQPSDVPAAGAMLTAKASGDADVIAWLQTRGGQSADVLRITQNVSDAQWARFDKIGRLGISNPYAPTAADLRDGEVMLTFDAAAAKLVLTAKDASGNLRSGTVALS